jgi:hypothetical protein
MHDSWVVESINHGEYSWIVGGIDHRGQKYFKNVSRFCVLPVRLSVRPARPRDKKYQ